MKKLYERYHSKRKSQKRLIDENDFTYRSLIHFIKKYVQVNDKIKFFVQNFPNTNIKEKFEVIICSEVLEHLPQDKLAIRKIRNLLVKNGVVIASSPSENAPLYKVGILNNFDSSVGHLRRYTEKSFRNLFEYAGFNILETNKTEGVIRNFLFTNQLGGFLLRILNKWPISNVVTVLDNLTIRLLGESNIYLVAEKK